jgi:AraC family transcriptional regulator
MTALGRVYFWRGGSLWIGRGSGRTQWHDHHAHQITLPFTGACLFRGEENGAWGEYAGAFVQSERHHQFEMEASTAAQIFVEPETTEGRALALRFAGADISPLPESDRAAMAGMLMTAHRAGGADAAMIATARAAIAMLASTPIPAAAVDGRIAKALELIAARIRGPIRLADAAGAAALSPSRFRHLFVQETGAAFRAYVLWSRLNVAIECSMAGGSWTAAAHEAGFADSAHLTRTFKRMFGMNPATLVRG